LYIDILILACLREQPAHGYEIKKRVERILGGSLTLNNNLLYPALKRFEELSAVTREVERHEGRPDRHTYRLTDRGAEVLQALLHEFSPALARDQVEFLVRVAFFHLLDPPARREILRGREAALTAHLAHFDRVLPQAERATNPGGARVIAFLTRQIQQELEWIAYLAQETTQETAKENQP
jgi:DNA-binding PadR family transcriptional regulator